MKGTLTKLTNENLTWMEEAEDAAAIWGLDKQDVEAVIRHPQQLAKDRRSEEVGYLIMRYRAGDVVAVVGYREITEPFVMYVCMVFSLPGPVTPGLRRSAGHGKGRRLPHTPLELRRRIKELADPNNPARDYSFVVGSTHCLVVDGRGKYVMTLPIVPGDHRTIPNCWATFVKKDRERQKVTVDG